MKNKNYIPFLIVIMMLAVVSFLVIRAPQSLKPEDIRYVKIAGRDVKVDLATTIADQELGLSGRTGLEEDEGMLFVFEYSGDYHFWMQDMNFPIDIIWIGEDMSVIYIEKDARPELYPETYGPDADSKYVLEVTSGFSEKNNLKEGDRVEFEY